VKVSKIYYSIFSINIVLAPDLWYHITPKNNNGKESLDEGKDSAYKRIGQDGIG